MVQYKVHMEHGEPYTVLPHHNKSGPSHSPQIQRLAEAGITLDASGNLKLKIRRSWVCLPADWLDAGRLFNSFLLHFLDSSS